MRGSYGQVAMSSLPEIVMEYQAQWPLAASAVATQVGSCPTSTPITECGVQHPVNQIYTSILGVNR